MHSIKSGALYKCAGSCWINT